MPTRRLNSRARLIGTQMRPCSRCVTCSGAVLKCSKRAVSLAALDNDTRAFAARKALARLLKAALPIAADRSTTSSTHATLITMICHLLCCQAAAQRSGAGRTAAVSSSALRPPVTSALRARRATLTVLHAAPAVAAAAAVALSRARPSIGQAAQSSTQPTTGTSTQCQSLSSMSTRAFLRK